MTGRVLAHAGVLPAEDRQGALSQSHANPLESSVPCHEQVSVIQVPGYLIKQEVGIGGMASVYLAVQTSLEREVALKVMNPSMVSDPSFSRRFMQEARTLASLAHPNIVAVYDVGITEEKLHYFSMQHLPNGDFLRRIQLGTPESEVVRVLAGVARALGYAHQRGFVHRDVAPGNVLFDINDNPVLTDFGIARAVTKTSRITNAGVSVGTSHYMSPEQARGGDVDGRSDIYSLGALAFEAITGSPPYNGDDGFAIAYAHVFEPVPKVPPEKAHWQPLIDRAMAKDPTERFQNTEELLAELSRVEPKAGSRKTNPAPAATPSAAGIPTLAMPIPSTAISAPVVVDRTQPISAQALVDAATTQTPAVPMSVEKVTPLATRAVETLEKPVAVAAAIPAPRLPAKAPEPARSFKMLWLVLGLVAIGALLVGVGLWQQNRKSDDAPRLVDAPKKPDVAPTLPVRPATRPDSTVPLTVAADTELAGDTGELGMDGELIDIAVDGEVMDPLLEQQLRDALATTVVDPIRFLIAMGRADIAAQRLSQPPGRNATDRYRLLLRMRPDNEEARVGLFNTGKAFAAIAAEKLKEGKLDEWQDFSQRGIDTAGEFDTRGVLKADYEKQRTQLITPWLSAGAKAVERWDEAAAKDAYQSVLRVDPKNAQALAGMKSAAGIGKTGYRFTDWESSGRAAPEMVVASVAGKRLGVATGEISVSEFGRFWTASGSRTNATRPSCRDRESVFRSSRGRTWQSPGFKQPGNHPVVCVSWDDAKAYADWLTKVTGKRYRLLRADEWSAVAARAQPADGCAANVADAAFNGQYRDRDALSCNDGFVETAPVRKFAAFAGIHDLAGNVREWVSDCDAGCRKHLVMGSSWASTKNELTLQPRRAFDTDTAFNTVGFRVARELD